MVKPNISEEMNPLVSSSCMDSLWETHSQNKPTLEEELGQALSGISLEPNRLDF